MGFEKLVAVVSLLVLGLCPSFAFVFPSSRILRASSSSLDGVKITVNDDEPIENVLRRFKRSVNQSGHLMELRFKEQWENAHDKRKRKRERNMVLNKMERLNQERERMREGAYREYNS